MKYIKIIAVLSILTMVYFLSNNFGAQSGNSEAPVVVNNKKEDKNKTPIKNKHKKTATKKAQKPKDKYGHDSEIYKKLQVPDNRDLEYVWTDEYGCFNKAEGMAGKCKYDFLNARSYKEAIWMKNNGYPTQSMIDLINDPSYKDELDELARKKYPVALAIASIAAIERGDYREASNLALSHLAYSDNSKTYPHLLYGEALLVDDKKITAVAKFYVAGLLGDSLAHGKAMALSPDIYFSTSALNHAHGYLRRVFGSEIPRDPRPKANGDD